MLFNSANSFAYRKNQMIKALARFILFKLYNWKIVGSFPEDLKKYIVIGAPHTSNHDFIIGLCVKIILKVPVKFIGKKSLFKFPFGYFFRSVGGVPVNRKKNQKLVDSIIQMYNQRDSFILALSPEGTRSKVADWKTGFYHIAKGANISIVAFTFDFGRKQTQIFPPYYPTGDQKADFEYLKAIYSDVKGKVSENG